VTKTKSEFLGKKREFISQPVENLSELPDQDRWRLLYLGRLLEERGERFHMMEDTTGVTELIDSLCVN
jgi:hypothetical protein